MIAVENGQEGLHFFAQQTRPDVILLDMLLPTLEGVEVASTPKGGPDHSTYSCHCFVESISEKKKKLKMARAAACSEKSKLNLEEDGSVLLEAVEHVRADQTASRGAVV